MEERFALKILTVTMQFALSFLITAEILLSVLLVSNVFLIDVLLLLILVQQLNADKTGLAQEVCVIQILAIAVAILIVELIKDVQMVYVTQFLSHLNQAIVLMIINVQEIKYVLIIIA